MKICKNQKLLIKQFLSFKSKMKKLFLFLFVPCVGISAYAQKVKVEFFSPSIVRVVKTPDSATVEKKSLVVSAVPGKVAVKISSSNNQTTYKSNKLIVTVDEKTNAVKFASADGKQLMNEDAFSFSSINEGVDKGSYKVKQSFHLDADEPIYGVGLLQNGKMSQRGENRNMQQSNLEDFAHFFQSIKGYGIYWDNYSPTHLITPKEGTEGSMVLESQVGKLVDYYFMYGENADGVISQMRYLSGKVPMLPLWTYGFHQSRERYKSQAELLDVVRNYRERQIPLDGIIQDWQYWGSNYTWNAMEFINPDFGRAQDMIDEVHSKHAHMSISIWASFGPETKAFKELKQKNLLFDFETWPQSGLSEWPPRMDYPSGVRVFDCYSKEARDIYWKNLSRLHKMGIDAWWMDSTDPDHMNYKDSDLDQKCAMGSWRSVRNIFPYMTVGGVYDNQRAVDSSKRVFILTRSYFAGQQRTGANTWSGDINSSWQSLRNQVPICLNYTLTANPNVNTDIGGFFANSYNKHSQDNSACSNPQYQELYVRWMQFGAFCPMMRSHGTEVYREIYHFGKPGEPVFDALKSAIELRYKLIPYIYSTSWQVSKNDYSFMRALMMDFKNDKNVWNNNRQYMFGQSFLVCPVVDPLYTQEKIIKTDAMTGWDSKDNNDEYSNGWPKADWAQMKNYSIYLPAGADWFDYWTNKKYTGGQTLNSEAPIAHSPLYVRAGSIVPMGPQIQYTDGQKWENIDIVVYPGKDAEFTLYEDEGDNYNYEKGQYSTIKMTWNDKTQTLNIGKRAGSFNGMIKSRKFNVKVIGGKSKTVDYIGNSLTVK